MGGGAIEEQWEGDTNSEREGWEKERNETCINGIRQIFFKLSHIQKKR